MGKKAPFLRSVRTNPDQGTTLVPATEVLPDRVACGDYRQQVGVITKESVTSDVVDAAKAAAGGETFDNRPLPGIRDSSLIGREIPTVREAPKVAEPIDAEIVDHPKVAAYATQELEALSTIERRSHLWTIRNFVTWRAKRIWLVITKTISWLKIRYFLHQTSIEQVTKPALVVAKVAVFVAIISAIGFLFWKSDQAAMKSDVAQIKQDATTAATAAVDERLGEFSKSFKTDLIKTEGRIWTTVNDEFKRRDALEAKKPAVMSKEEVQMKLDRKAGSTAFNRLKESVEMRLMALEQSSLKTPMPPEVLPYPKVTPPPERAQPPVLPLPPETSN